MDLKPPRHLYKILSARSWQATQNRKTVMLSSEDDAFIHLATEEQLDKIIDKYWSGSAQFAILKLNVEELQGKLVLEANPGGSTRYYHLYEGFIPFSAIVEAKDIFRGAADVKQSNALEIVQIGDLVLRQPARRLSREEILSDEIQKLIQDMQATMRAAPGVGLAAPQIGKPIQLAVIEDMDHSHLSPEQLNERERTQVPFHVIINPILYKEGNEEAEFFEACLSIPKLLGLVPRAKSVRVECLNEHAEPVIIHAKGWYARILQHEIDHLNATLFIDRSDLKSLMTDECYSKQWRGKSVQEIKEELRK